jgi:hypothetical protein
MLHYIIISVLVLLVLACVIVLFNIKSDDDPPKLPKDIADKYEKTNFYRAVAPNQGLPPVPVRDDPKTTLIPIQVQGRVGTDTALIPAIRQR